MSINEKKIEVVERSEYERVLSLLGKMKSRLTEALGHEHHSIYQSLGSAKNKDEYVEEQLRKVME